MADEKTVPQDETVEVEKTEAAPAAEKAEKAPKAEKAAKASKNEVLHAAAQGRLRAAHRPGDDREVRLQEPS